ncbi:hypothetical protein CYME_CMO261C [Cyanidioschyzon merolae strain 10D]|uniref:Uncharacterized protein n=1 Tax=Cyanidioschyzon merolae (strain NIES-3377 / 10D) TaxID=280699 RepID=M1V9L5_CYAM1|nr:hypothetical protein CYME_CMO261C [Cyanidioschyzon merolae strain 10D]BAM81604.1 hypothetical protein CYME_CMO261C [Cyanidioschyzon merolae strain 10D]|eukprot:XP_005537640.1 hypothetical protein CYME_CMO261C [Cyanidioschyzon merolae strain 10D]
MEAQERSVDDAKDTCIGQKLSKRRPVGCSVDCALGFSAPSGPPTVPLRRVLLPASRVRTPPCREASRSGTVCSTRNVPGIARIACKSRGALRARKIGTQRAVIVLRHAQRPPLLWGKPSPALVFGLGTLLAAALVWNRLANLTLVEGTRARADLVGAIASSALLLYAVSAWQIEVRSTAPVRIRDGHHLEQTETIALGGELETALAWLIDTVFGACANVTTAVWLTGDNTGRIVAQRGMVKAALGSQVDLRRFEELGVLNLRDPVSSRYFADLKTVPRSIEWQQLLPADTQSAWLGTFKAPLQRDGSQPAQSCFLLILGCNKIRGFLDKDLEMLACFQQQWMP